MVQAWFMDSSKQDQRLEHHRTPPKYLTLDELFKKSGVEYFKLDPENYAEELDMLKKKRGYTYEDNITCSKECLENYEEKLKTFFAEHLHTEEEIRFVLQGSGYFDVRDINEEWIRIAVSPGDLIIIPAGIYHRFTLDTRNFIQAKRFFIGQPVWTPYNRPADSLECRQKYLQRAIKGFEE
ncbi:acireductone dioxygenase-like [Bacillus rossius redtenbacheri]|uniref:acireductone dioxygenase-like n=1 Tax=Bacillus rossius redtenbacheri TaxID=93214 RepID=UPI002FDCD1EF